MANSLLCRPKRNWYHPIKFCCTMAFWTCLGTRRVVGVPVLQWWRWCKTVEMMAGAVWLSVIHFSKLVRDLSHWS